MYTYVYMYRSTYLCIIRILSLSLSLSREKHQRGGGENHPLLRGGVGDYTVGQQQRQTCCNADQSVVAAPAPPAPLHASSTSAAPSGEAPSHVPEHGADSLGSREANFARSRSRDHVRGTGSIYLGMKFLNTGSPARPRARRCAPVPPPPAVHGGGA